MKSQLKPWEVTGLGFILALSFLVRFVLLGSSSLWFDELLAVKVYGSDPTSLSDMVSSLAATSVHPPLYQIILYVWLDWFGTTPEVARLLSTIFVLGAIVLAFFLVRIFAGGKVGLLAAFSVSVSFIALNYSLEARSYALQLLLATASSLLFWRVLTIGSESGPWRAKSWLPMLGLFVVNLCFLFTHYLGLFFLTSQAVFLAVFVPMVYGRAKLIRTAAVWAAFYLGQVGIFFAVWGSFLSSTYQKRSAGLSDLDGTPFSLGTLASNFVETVIDPNVPVNTALVMVIAILGVWAAWIWYQKQRAETEVEARVRAWFGPYLVLWTVIPFLCSAVFSAVTPFSSIGVRYSASSSPAVRILLVLGLLFLAGECRRWMGGRAQRVFYEAGRFGLLLGTAALIVISVPTYGKFIQAKVWTLDYTARAVANDLRSMSKDGLSFVVWEAGTREVSTLDYYLSEFSPAPRSSRRLTAADEREAAQDLHWAEKNLGSATSAGRLVVTFTHRRERDFSALLGSIEAVMSRESRMMDTDGHGYIVYTAKEAP